MSIGNHVTHAGRFVRGDCFNKKAKVDQKTKQPKLNQDGTPRMVLFVAVAFAKTDPLWPALEAKIKGDARQAWPTYFDPAGNCTNPNFAFKIIDGDGFDKKGQPYSRNEGYAGHWVLNFENQFPNGVFRPATEQERQLFGKMNVDAEPGSITPGDYIKVQFTTDTNKSNDSPGIYLNLGMIQFSHKGEPIKFQGDADEVFGGSDAAGTTIAATPVSKTVGGMPVPVALPAANGVTYDAYRAAGWTDDALKAANMFAFPAPAAAPPPPPPPVTAAAPPPPHTTFMQPAVAPPPPVVAAPPPPPIAMEPVMLPAANGVPYASYKAQGWTDEQLVSANMFAM